MRFQLSSIQVAIVPANVNNMLGEVHVSLAWVIFDLMAYEE